MPLFSRMIVGLLAVAVVDAPHAARCPPPGWRAILGFCAKAPGLEMYKSLDVNNLTLSIGDTPPSGVAVLFLEASITAASLQPADMSKPAVSLMNTPVELEFGHLQTDTAFVSLPTSHPIHTRASR